MCLCAGFFLGVATSNNYILMLQQEDLCLNQQQYHLQSKTIQKNPSISSNGGKKTSSSNQDCVCGVAVERLKRLAKIALYVSSSNLSSNGKNCNPMPPTAEPEDKEELQRFLHPHDRMVQNYKEAERMLHSYKPKTLEEEYVFKQQLFVAVLTQQEYLQTRAKYLYETWGRELEKLVFFVGEDCNISTALSYLPIVKLVGIRDREYPPLKKSFAVLKYMYEHHMHQFDWFVRADDDVYLRVGKLKALLAQIHPYDNVYLGRAGTGRKDDLERLLLLPHEKYCMGGPGIILSTGMLRHLGPHLSNCLEAGR